MTTFHENIRNVFAEVDKFIESLKGEKLSKKVQAGKEKLIETIKKLREEWPALENPANNNELKVPEASETDHVSNESIKTKSSHGSANAEEEEPTYSENVPEKSVKDLTDPVKFGYLEKKRKKATLIQSAYQKRFCVIKDRIFYYFERNTDKKQAGAFCLEGYEFKEASQYVPAKEANKKFCFELTASEKRPFQFLVESKEEFQSWQEAITGTGSSGTPGDFAVEGEFEDIYEEMDDVAEQAKALAQSETSAVEEPDQEVYDDAATMADEGPDEIYDDVDNTDQSKVAQTEPANNLPPPVPPPLKKPAMPLPDLPPTIQDQPLPEVPPPRPEKVPPRPKFQIKEDPDEDYENMYYGKWDCNGDGEDELSFKHGDVIHIINKEFDNKDWWVGRLNEKYGLVPKNYLIRAYKAV